MLLGLDLETTGILFLYSINKMKLCRGGRVADAIKVIGLTL